MKTEPPGTLAMVLHLSKAVHRASSDELLGMRLRQFLVLSYLQPAGAEPPAGPLRDADAGRQQLRPAAQRAGGRSAGPSASATRRTGAATSSCITAEGAAALKRARKAQETLEDEMLAALDARRARAAARAAAQGARRPPRAGHRHRQRLGATPPAGPWAPAPSARCPGSRRTPRRCRARRTAGTRRPGAARSRPRAASARCGTSTCARAARARARAAIRSVGGEQLAVGLVELPSPFSSPTMPSPLESTASC